MADIRLDDSGSSQERTLAGLPFDELATKHAELTDAYLALNLSDTHRDSAEWDRGAALVAELEIVEHELNERRRRR